MSATSIIVCVDDLAKRPKSVRASKPRTQDGDNAPCGWVDFGEFSLYGRDSAAFRCLAEQCSEAAAAIEAAAAELVRVI